MIVSVTQILGQVNEIIKIAAVREGFLTIKATVTKGQLDILGILPCTDLNLHGKIILYKKGLGSE